MSTIDTRLMRLTRGALADLGSQRRTQETVKPQFLATAEEIIHFAETAAPGAKLAYCAGFISADRADFHTARPVTSEQMTANAMASLAWALHEAGKVTLVQRRLGEGRYSYEMQKRRPVVKRQTHAGPIE